MSARIVASDVVIPDEFPTQDLLALATIWRNGDLSTSWPQALGHGYLVLGWGLNKGGCFKDSNLIIGDDGHLVYTPEAVECIHDCHCKMVGPVSEMTDPSEAPGPLVQAMMVALIKFLSEWLLSKEAAKAVSDQLVEFLRHEPDPGLVAIGSNLRRIRRGRWGLERNCGGPQAGSHPARPGEGRLSAG